MVYHENHKTIDKEYMYMPTFRYTDREQMNKEIKKLLIDVNISQAEIARRLGITPQGLTKILNKQNFSFEDALKILHAIGYDLVVTFDKTPVGDIRPGE